MATEMTNELTQEVLNELLNTFQSRDIHPADALQLLGVVAATVIVTQVEKREFIGEILDTFVQSLRAQTKSGLDQLVELRDPGCALH